MMVDPIIYLVWTLVLIAVGEFLPRKHRALLAAATGLAFLAIYSPAAALVLCFTCIQAIALYFLAKKLPRGSKLRKHGPYLILLNLLFVDFLHDMIGISVVLIGVSFSIIRIFISIKRFSNSRTAGHLDFLAWGFVSAFYLPTLIIGPVFSSYEMWESTKRENKPEYKIGHEFRLIFSGLFLAVLASPFFSKVAERLPDLLLAQTPEAVSAIVENGLTPVVAVILFLSLFAAFWGQSLMAERLSRLVGFEVPQNFKQPWRAVDIRDFWTRWHTSMAEFVKNYIFIPLNLAGYNARIAIFTAFLFMGLWHNISIGYLLWGIGHGTLLALWPQNIQYERTMVRWLSRLFTFAAVVTLSYVANYAFHH